MHYTILPFNNTCRCTQRTGVCVCCRAVRSRSSGMVAGVLAWGEHRGLEWGVTLTGPHGITPLHLAAMLDDDGVIALQLMDVYGPAALTGCASADGVTPFHLSFQMGHYGVDRLIQVLKSEDVARVLARHTTAAGGIDVCVDNRGVGGRPYSPLDPCEVCHSTLPPLLLSVIARCLACGKRKRLSAADPGAAPHARGGPTAACCEQVSATCLGCSLKMMLM